MTMCPQCNLEVEEDARFCSHCGEEVKTWVEAQSAEAPEPGPGAREVCPGCGQEVEAATAFCAHCGQKQGPGALPPRVQPLPPVPVYEIHTEDALKTGWKLFRQYPEGFVAFFALLGVIALLNFIPFIGTLAFVLLYIPLSIGPFIVALRLLRLQPVEFKDFFSGFRYFLQLFLLYLVVGAALFLVSLPFLLLMFLGGWLLKFAFLPLLVLAMLLAVFCIKVFYLFAALLIADRGLEFWPAMELSRHTAQRRWFELCGFIIILALLNLIIGGLTLGLGLFITGPVSWCAVTALYARVFGLEGKENS